MPTLDEIAAEADARAEELEEEFRRLALTLFAFELAMMTGAISRARSDDAVLRALRTAVSAYRSPTGLFRSRWEAEFSDLLFRAASDHSRFELPVIGTPPSSAPSVPTELRRAIETHAEEIAANVSQVSAAKVEAAADAIAGETIDRNAGTPPTPPTPPAPPDGPAGPPPPDERLESLARLIGRKPAEEIMRVIRDGRAQGWSIAKVAKNLVEQVHSTEVTRRRAQTIARTETIGLVNMTEHERAVATGVLNEKRQVTQRDSRVRESHQRNEAQGWIPIEERYQNGLMYPGERPAPPEEVIGCRCSQAFRFNAQRVADAKRLPPLPPIQSVAPTRPKLDPTVSVLDGGGRDTLMENTVDGTHNGALTPERKAIHDRIVDDYFRDSGATPVKNPQAFTMGGGASSGKSSMEKMLTLPDNRMKVDVDVIRTKLPEWDAEGRAAKAAGRTPSEHLGAYTHEEASAIAKRIVARGTAEGYNLVIDGVGDSGIEKLTSKVKGYKALGAPVTANYMTIDFDEAYRRMRKRGDDMRARGEIPRYVPGEEMRFQHEDVTRTFYQAIRDGLFDQFTLWDNSGKGPVIVAEGRRSSVIIHRQDLWDAFLKRGRGITLKPGQV